MISLTSGRTAACSSIAPPSRSSTPTMTMVNPSRCASSRASRTSWRQLDPFHLHEPLAADPDRSTVDLHGNAVTDLVLCFVGRRRNQVQVVCLVQDRQGNRVVELPLGCRGVTEDLVRRESRGRDHASHLGAFPRQRPGLVEEDRVDLVHQLQRPAVLDQNALVSAKGQRAEHGEWRAPSGCPYQNRY